MIRTFLAMAVLLSGTARGAAPNYSAAGIVNTADYTPGPFAPNSVVTIFGSGLARSAEGLGLPAGAIKLPFELNYARVYVSDHPAPLLYASDTQINFLIPSDLCAICPQGFPYVTIRVAVEGSTIANGPEITVALVDAAPALFPMAGGYAIATHADGTLLTADSPAHGWDFVVIYLTGLGPVSPRSAIGDIPSYPSEIVPLNLKDLTVSLGGTVMHPDWIKYAGVTPGCAGLYQINLALPDNLGTDPEIRVAVAGQSSPAGLKLPVR